MSRICDGRVVIITGAGRGLGRAHALAFARAGARVVVNDLGVENDGRGGSSGPAHEVVEEIRAAGGEAIANGADVADFAQTGALVKATLDAFGRLDVVVNNAGWTHRRKPYLDVTEEEFDRVYAVNVKSVYLSARHALPVFRKRGGGCFVNIASTAGLRPRPGLTVYNSSKGAVILLSKSMAAEFGPDKVRVNCVNPVFSPDTALSADFAGGALTPEAKAAFLATIPLGRFSTPLDVANACLYLASDEAAMISGTCIEVDGARCV